MQLPFDAPAPSPPPPPPSRQPEATTEAHSADEMAPTASEGPPPYDDELPLVRPIQADRQIAPRPFPPGQLLSAISSAKNERRDAARYRAEASSYFEEIVGRVFVAYDESLRRNGAVDFDDLLGLTLA